MVLFKSKSYSRRGGRTRKSTKDWRCRHPSVGKIMQFTDHRKNVQRQRSLARSTGATETEIKNNTSSGTRIKHRTVGITEVQLSTVGGELQSAAAAAADATAEVPLLGSYWLVDQLPVIFESTGRTQNRFVATSTFYKYTYIWETREKHHTPITLLRTTHITWEQYGCIPIYMKHGNMLYYSMHR